MLGLTSTALVQPLEQVIKQRLKVMLGAVLLVNLLQQQPLELLKIYGAPQILLLVKIYQQVLCLCVCASSPAEQVTNTHYSMQMKF